MASIDEALFHGWQSGDYDARDKVWLLLWQTLYSVAFRFCRRFCRDDPTAEELATDALNKAIDQVGQLILFGKVKWEGGESFVAFVHKRLILRCLDEIRSFKRRGERLVSLDARTGNAEEEGEPLLDWLGFSEASPEEALLVVENMRETIRLVAAAHEMCRRQRVLADVLEGMKRYLRQCLAETVWGGVDCAALTFDKLLEIANLESLEVSKTEMYQFLMKLLCINRNTLDQRMKRIHAILRGLREAGDN